MGRGFTKASPEPYNTNELILPCACTVKKPFMRGFLLSRIVLGA